MSVRTNATHLLIPIGYHLYEKSHAEINYMMFANKETFPAALEY